MPRCFLAGAGCQVAPVIHVVVGDQYSGISYCVPCGSAVFMRDEWARIQNLLPKDPSAENDRRALERTGS